MNRMTDMDMESAVITVFFRLREIEYFAIFPALGMAFLRV